MSEYDSDIVLVWISKSRKLEEEKRNNQKEKALELSRVFEEQDDIIPGESDDDEVAVVKHNLSGVKVLHELDKLTEDGEVVFTLKDQSILANGDINDEVDMLENVEIGEQKQRSEAYKAVKKNIYVDKFNDDPKIHPHYDDGVTLDANGRFSGEVEKKLEELRKRIDHIEDLVSINKTASDYYTYEEMLKFKKPKKKKLLRKKEKLDLDALEAEAVSAGLGIGDLGSRKDAKRQALKEEQEKLEAERRTNAYKSAYARANEASKALRLEQQIITKKKDQDDEIPVFYDGDDEDLRKSLDSARRLALKKKDDETGDSAPSSIALLVSSASKDNDTCAADKETQENKVVFTDRDGRVCFYGGKTLNKEEEIFVPDEIIHEVPVGKGLSGALKLLKDRGSLGQGIEWGGCNMDKRKSRLVGTKEICIDRTDEYGRPLTLKESFKLFCHKFHGKNPGKMKQEKRKRQYKKEQKIKQMRNSDTPLLSAQRMRDLQAELKTPFLVLSRNVKPMLGDRKVEHILGIKRKFDAENMGPPPKMPKSR